jgi:hypothetical protein
MNTRHKTILALSLAVAGFALLHGAKISEALGIILLGASLAWLIGSHFVLGDAMFVWSHRIRFADYCPIRGGGHIRLDQIRRLPNREARYYSAQQH